MNAHVTTQTGTVSAPGGTINDHVNFDLLNSDTSIAQSIVGTPGSGIPTAVDFLNVPAGQGYLVRARNFDQHNNQIGPDVLSSPFDVVLPNQDVTVVNGLGVTVV